jgi:hypothetical protein
MVWGIEQVVRLATGKGRRGSEVAAEILAHRLRFIPPPAPNEPLAPIGYKAMTSVPENWIPFIAVHVPGDNGQSGCNGPRGPAKSTAAGAATH